MQGGGNFEHNIEWFRIGTLQVQLGFYVDGLTAVMLVVVTSISLMVHIYSLGYMHGDKRYTWFYVVLSIFTGAMLVVVLASNLFQLLVGWEIMGVCSYLLIGHWYEDHANSSAAIKAFLTTRVGDVPFMFGIFALVYATGMTTSNIQVISETVAAGHVSVLLITCAALLMFGGTIGKSAQFPLYTWLPDAMAGPTPVSALIHAATMVAAGIYLVARTFEVFVQADPIALTIVSIIGAITLLLAALLALVQDDIKKVLAYSTISQLAYMVAALGMGEAGYPAAMFHLFTHAFFKALLFLGAGSVIHAAHSNNMSDMGGLRKHMKLTYATFVIGSLALAGVPPFAGFFSKDEIILVAKDSQTYWLGAVLLVGAVITAFYTTRMVLKTFHGEYRGTEHLHESPRLDDDAARVPGGGHLLRRPARVRPGRGALHGLGVLRRRSRGARLQPARGRGLDPGGRHRDPLRATASTSSTARPIRSRSWAGSTTCSSTSTTWTTSTGAASSARSATRGRPASTGSTSTCSTPS